MCVFLHPQYIGNTGSVLKYDDDDNVVVRIGSRDLLLHPGCIQKARSEMKDGQPPSKEVGSGKVAFPPDAEPSGTTASGDKPVNDLMKKEKGNGHTLSLPMFRMCPFLLWYLLLCTCEWSHWLFTFPINLYSLPVMTSLTEWLYFLLIA